MQPIKQLRQLTEDVSNVAMDDGSVGDWSVIVPEATANLIENPSFETNTTGWAGNIGGETLARSGTRATHGFYSLKVTPTPNTSSGVKAAVTLLTDTIYTFSVDVWATPHVQMRLQLTDGVTGVLGEATFVGSGAWQRVILTTRTATATACNVKVMKNNALTTLDFYVDSAVLEQKSFPTTYCDGDQPGCIWTGILHGSVSTRDASAAEGGRVRNFREFKFTAAAVIGAGAPAHSNIIDAYALVGGGNYQRSITPPHSFSIVGRFECETTIDLKRQRQALHDAIKPRRTPQPQLMHLIHQPTDNGQPVGREIVIPCVYKSGLEGNHSVNVGESVALEFDVVDPYAVGRALDEGAVVLAGTQTLLYTDHCMRRAGGEWLAMGRGTNGSVLTMARGLDGLVYVGGTFTTVYQSDGTPLTANYIAAWNPRTQVWSAPFGTGGTAAITSIAIAPNGDVYIGGVFTNWAGIAAADYVAKWDGSAWSALGTGGDASVFAVAAGPDGSIYAAGIFTAMGGVANTSRIAKWNGSAWVALGTGANGEVDCLAVAPDGTLYAGGVFTLMGGVASTVRVAKWNGSAWSALSTGANDTLYMLTVAPDGTLYAGGMFTTIGGVSVNRIAKWNGSAWVALGSGLNNYVRDAVVDSQGHLYVVGEFTTAGGISAVGIAIWNGSAWVRMDANLPASAVGHSVFLVANNENDADVDDIYVGFDGTNDALTAVRTIVSVGGTADVYPRIVFTTSSGLIRLTNFTTSEEIYFNTNILAGERATLQLGAAPTFKSTFRPNMLNTILPGSNLATWRLVPGENVISLFGPNDTLLVWHDQYDSIDGAALI